MPFIGQKIFSKTFPGSFLIDSIPGSTIPFGGFFLINQTFKHMSEVTIPEWRFLQLTTHESEAITIFELLIKTYIDEWRKDNPEKPALHEAMVIYINWRLDLHKVIFDGQPANVRLSSRGLMYWSDANNSKTMKI